MYYKKVKDKISEIAEIEEPEECQKEVRLLDQELKTPATFISHSIRGRFVYFYKRYLDSKTKSIPLGKMAIKDFEVFDQNNWKDLPEDELKRFLTPIR